MTHKIYLSRRNLLTLLSKLEREANGEETKCTIIKYKHSTPAYQQSMDCVEITAVSDQVYYKAQNRPIGEIHPADEVKLMAID